MPAARLTKVPALALSRVVRWSRFAGTALIAVVAMFAALLLAIRFVVFPNIHDYRDQIAARLSAALGQRVAIESIATGWDGWNPKLSIAGFAVHDRTEPAGPPSLLLPRVDLVVSWTSLALGDLRLNELVIERPQLAVRRDRTGRLHVAGIEIDPETQSDDTRVTDWLLRQREIVVNDALLTWTDDLRGAPQLVLDHVMFRVEHSFGRHRFGLVGEPPAALAAPLDFRGEVTAASLADWRQARGRFYIRLDYADVALWREWIPPLQPVASGKGALRVWFDFADGRATNVTADVELTDVSTRLARDLPKLDLALVSGRLTWTHDAAEREITTRGLTFRTQGGLEQPPMALSVVLKESAEGEVTGGRVAFDKVEMTPLSSIAAHLPLPEAWRRDLAAYALRGNVSGGKYAWEGPLETPAKYAGSGTFAGLGIAAHAAVPGASGVSGNVTFDQAKGELKLDSRDLRVVVPRVFPEALLLESATGRLGWARSDESWRFTFDDLRFATPHVSGTASGTWRSRPQGPGIIELKAQLARFEAQHLDRYLPVTLERPVRDWLRFALKRGTASDAKIALAGDLAHFPFADAREGQFLATFKTEGATLDYADGWPEITGIDANVRLEGAGIAVNASHGRILGTQIGPVKLDIPNLRVPYPLLTVTGEATGSTTEFLSFVEKSPVAGWIGHFTDGAQATGNGKLTLRFEIPLGKGDGVKVAGGYQFLANQVQLPGVPKLAQVNGHLNFTEQSMQSRDLVAEVLGGPTRIAVASSEGRVKVSANGTATVASVRNEFDLPLLRRASGTAEWQFAGTPRDSTWTLESNLQGAVIELPAPVGKAAAETAALKIERREVAGKPHEDVIAVDYRGELRVVAHRTFAKERTVVDRALLLLGSAIARGGTADRPGLWVRGTVPELDLDEWLALYAKEMRGSGAAPRAPSALELRGVDLEAGRLDIFGRALHDLKVVARQAGDDWRLRLSGREIEGTATWRGPTAALPNGRVTARLARLVPPGVDELHPTRSEIIADDRATNTWPELDIVADAIVSRGHDLGKFELLAQPSAADWRISKLSLVNPAGRIDATGVWRVGRERQTTEIDASLATNDAGAFLDRFGYPVAVTNAPTKITGKLTWAGAPSDFDYPTLSGNFHLQTGAGQFTKIDPGIGKLLGVLSLRALPRRISLDFRDVFSEGFAFDEVTGDFRVQNGLMHTDNLKLVGPAATVNITGDIDLGQETQRLAVRVQPALSSSVSAGAAVLFLANPIVGAAVGAGTLLAQKLFNNPIDQMFSYEYRVTGSWSDPQVERAGARLVSSGVPGASDGNAK